MRISIIVAAAENGVIGDGGAMPWRMPSDLKRFRLQTMGKPVVMGRKTFQSLPKALDGRDNIVVTRDRSFRAEGVETVTSLDDALILAAAHATRRGCDEVLVIGGGEVYAAALPRADRVYLTRIHAALSGDTTFPPLDSSLWRLSSEEPIPQGPKDDYEATLMIFDRFPET